MVRLIRVPGNLAATGPRSSAQIPQFSLRCSSWSTGESPGPERQLYVMEVLWSHEYLRTLRVERESGAAGIRMRHRQRELDSKRRGASWHMEAHLAKKGRSFVLPPEIHWHMPAATGDGQRESASGKGQEPSCKFNCQVEIVKCFEGRRRKKKRRPHPGRREGVDYLTGTDRPRRSSHTRNQVVKHATIREWSE